jgi:uncharacterized protein (DUF433 family)
MTDTLANPIESFVARWQGVTASELATAQSFVIELCGLLGVAAPAQPQSETELASQFTGKGKWKSRLPSPPSAARVAWTTGGGWGKVICMHCCPESAMDTLDRITQNPAVMGGKPCIRGMRVTVGTVVGQIAAGRSIEAILDDYPYLEREDIAQALRYAAWRAEEREVLLTAA